MNNTYDAIKETFDGAVPNYVFVKALKNFVAKIYGPEICVFSFA
jgi:hypothetical protein